MAECAYLISTNQYAHAKSDTPPNYIDINMGCPVKKIVSNGEGSALLKNPDLCGQIVKKCVEVSKVPVTVKIRAGWDKHSINAVEVAKICEEAGASAICVHPRTRSQGYSGKADWNIIKEVKEAVSIPVIGNGDIIDIDIPARTINVRLTDEELAARTMFPLTRDRVISKSLKAYASMVSSADKGGIRIIE